MKSYLKKIALLSLWMTFLPLTSTDASGITWDIVIELSKQEYVLHEPILLDVTLTNNTSDTVRTHGLIEPNHYHFHILVTDSDGQEVEYTGPRSDGVWGSGKLLLNAGEEDYNCFNLLDLFKSVKFNSGYKVKWGRFPFMPRGNYTVMVYYEGSPSNELTFSIIEPYGPEAEVLRKIEQASQIWSQSDTDPSSRAFGEIARDYPNSAFAEKCYYLHHVYSNNMEGTIGLGKTGRIFRREMLTKFPNSANARGWLLAIAFGEGEDETIAIYDELIKEHPGTRCSKIASLLKKRMLAKRERGE